MIGKKISRRTSLICAAISVVVLLAAYSALSYGQHRRNPNDRTIPTWGLLWEGMQFLCEQPRAEESDTSDLLAAALAGRPGGGLVPAGWRNVRAVREFARVAAPDPVTLRWFRTGDLLDVEITDGIRPGDKNRLFGSADLAAADDHVAIHFSSPFRLKCLTLSA